MLRAAAKGLGPGRLGGQRGGALGNDDRSCNARRGLVLGRTALLAALCLMLISHWQMGLGAGTSEVQGSPYGAYGPEGPRMREQFWLLPGADPRVPLRATVFRPAESVGEGTAGRLRWPW